MTEQEAPTVYCLPPHGTLPAVGSGKKEILGKWVLGLNFVGQELAQS
jgi:hypothetical protein